MMCLVFCLPRRHVLKGITRCFRPRRDVERMPLIASVNSNSRRGNGAREEPSVDVETTRVISLIGCLLLVRQGPRVVMLVLVVVVDGGRCAQSLCLCTHLFFFDTHPRPILLGCVGSSLASAPFPSWRSWWATRASRTKRSSPSEVRAPWRDRGRGREVKREREVERERERVSE